MNIIEYGSHRRFIGAGMTRKMASIIVSISIRQMLYQGQKKQKKRQERQYNKVGRLAGIDGKTVLSDFL